jgi:hypothetical protein
MSCNCMKEFERMIVEKQPYRDLKITKATFDQALIFSDTGSLNNRPTLEIELTCEGRKHPVRKQVIYTFCPFCGNEFTTPNADQEAVKA